MKKSNKISIQKSQYKSKRKLRNSEPKIINK